MPRGRAAAAAAAWGRGWDEVCGGLGEAVTLLAFSLGTCDTGTGDSSAVCDTWHRGHTKGPTPAPNPTPMAATHLAVPQAVSIYPQIDTVEANHCQQKKEKKHSVGTGVFVLVMNLHGTPNRHDGGFGRWCVWVL